MCVCVCTAGTETQNKQKKTNENQTSTSNNVLNINKLFCAVRAQVEPKDTLWLVQFAGKLFSIIALEWLFYTRLKYQRWTRAHSRDTRWLTDTAVSIHVH